MRYAGFPVMLGNVVRRNPVTGCHSTATMVARGLNFIEAVVVVQSVIYVLFFALYICH